MMITENGWSKFGISPLKRSVTLTCDARTYLLILLLIFVLTILANSTWSDIAASWKRLAVIVQTLRHVVSVILPPPRRSSFHAVYVAYLLCVNCQLIKPLRFVFVNSTLFSSIIYQFQTWRKLTFCRISQQINSERILIEFLIANHNSTTT